MDKHAGGVKEELCHNTEKNADNAEAADFYLIFSRLCL